MLLEDLIDGKTGERKYLNLEERKRFFEITTFIDADKKFYCRLLYFTGCRLSEALELTPNHIDMESQGVILRTLKQKNEKSVYRFVEVHDKYLEGLNDAYAVLSKKGKDEGKLPIWNFKRRTAHNYIKEVMAKAGITGTKATARGLRHSLGVSLVQNKVPLNTVQQILGHKDIKNTMIYTQAVDIERRDMISRAW